MTYHMRPFVAMACVGSLLLSACTTSTFTDEIAQFSTATTTATAQWEADTLAIQQQAAKGFEETIVSGGKRGEMSDDCLLLADALVVDVDATSLPKVACKINFANAAPPEGERENLANMRKISRSLNSYTAALARTAAATSEAQLKADFAATGTDIDTLIASLVTFTRSDSAPTGIAGKAFNAALIPFSADLDAKRIAALRIAVNNSHDAIENSAKQIQDLTRSLRRAQFLQSMKTLEARVDAWNSVRLSSNNTAKKKKALSDLRASEAALNAAASAVVAPSAFMKIASTHGALRDALNNGAGVEDMTQFFIQLRALKDAVNAIQPNSKET